MESEKKHFQQYLLTYFVALAFLGLPLALNALFIRNIGEIRSFSETAALQQKEDAIYGPAYSGVDMRYKLELIKLRQPEILVLGASRMMQYREEIFNVPFVNSAGSMNHLNEGLIFLKEVFKVHKPKVLVLGLEFFWFNDEFFQPAVFASHEADETRLTRDKLLDPLSQLIKKRLSAKDYVATLTGNTVKPQVFDNRSYGLAAMASAQGTLPDGSTLYTALYSGMTRSGDAKFTDTLARIHQGVGRFEYGAHMSSIRWKIFEDIVSLCKEHQVKLVTILSPFAPSISRAMSAMPEEYHFIAELNDTLKARHDFEYYDFRDATLFGSNDCEFIDGFHPGHVTCFRLIRELLRRNPNSVLAASTRSSFLDDQIRKYSGHALWLGRLKPRFSQEADFLELGCKKTPWEAAID